MKAFSYSLYTSPYLFNLEYVSQTHYGNTLHLQYSTTVIDLDYSMAYQSNKIANANKDYSLLPMAVRYVSPDSRTYFIERPPFQIPIDYSVAKSYRKRRQVKALVDQTVWVPWTLSVINVDSRANSMVNLSIYFNDGPITSAEDFVNPCYFPNSSSGNICMGQDSVGSSSDIAQSNIVDIYNHMFNSYFSGWNSDLPITVDCMDYFDDLKEDILAQKDCPKSLSSFFANNGWNYDNSEVHKNFLYIMSKIDLQTTLGFISCLKQKEKTLGSSIARSVQLKTLMEIASPQKNSNFSFILGYSHAPTYLIRNLFNFLDNQGRTDKPESSSKARVTVEIPNFSGFSDDQINNPFLISLIYQKHMANISSDYQSLDLKVDYSLLQPYTLTNGLIDNANSH